MEKIDIIENTESKAIVDDDLLLEHNQELDQDNIQNSKIEKDFPMKNSLKLFLTLTIIAVLAGVGTGFGSFKLFAKSTSTNTIDGKTIQQLPTAGKIQVGDVFGSTDEAFDTFAEGYLEEGGIDGEGSYKLLRPGGISQRVYLTSSVTDLSKLVGMQIKVWGETFKGQKAGWLMDVGRAEVLDIDAESPEVE